MPNQYQVEGQVAEALFTLKIHRGEGMALLAMNWRDGHPPDDFVGFSVEYREPGGTKFFPLKNRLTFDGNAGSAPSFTRPPTFSTLISPIQKFRWVHFPRNAELVGAFSYRVKPVFMNPDGSLSYGVAQTADIELARETIPGRLNVAFTRGFVSSQAFVDRYLADGPLDTLLPEDATGDLTFRPEHRDAEGAYAWMGFEARRAILSLLDEAIADQTATVGIVAYDLNLPEIVQRVERLAGRVRVIIDDSEDHHGGGAAEDKAEKRLRKAGVEVKRQSMGKLQHNKTIFVSGDTVRRAICGSTNMSWRGLYVQSNNVLLVESAEAVRLFEAAFDQYWNDPDKFARSPSADWSDLGVEGVDARITFSPHNKKNSVLRGIASDIDNAISSLLYSLAFLSITPGTIRKAIERRSNADGMFVAGISDKRAGVRIDVGSSNLPPTYVAALDENAPKPFSKEPTALARKGGGTRMHHKFIVLDFNTDDARVYLGSYNMSKAADDQNGENLVLVRNRRVATAYMIEALRIIDHYQFRAARKAAKRSGKSLKLQRPPSNGDKPWFAEDYDEPSKATDREIFS